ncbi:DUF4150 domain-containing protein, partial [Myxococcus xanthus]
KSVTINGHPVALTDSELSVSSGDEPGTAGGLISSKFKGKVAWGSGSVDVRIEGKGVVRYLDVTLHNGNSFNTTFMSNGRAGTGFAYADDFEGVCIICEKDPDSHAVLELPEQSLAIANEILQRLKAREAEWARVAQELAKKDAELKHIIANDANAKLETLDGRKATIDQLKLERDKLGTHRRARSGSYMVGVLVCRGGKRVAAISGGETPVGFKEIAGDLGCEVIEEAATLNDFISMNPRSAAGDTEATNRLKTQWDDTMRNYGRGEPGYSNEPGTCAGAKLIGKSGHVADSMTEMMFSFSSNRKALEFNVFYRGPNDFAPTVGPWKPPSAADVETGNGSKRAGERVDMRRRKEETVLSCRSCQDTLYLARCDHEKQRCAKCKKQE